MNVAMLDQLNRDGALRHIAQCGGLVAIPQLQGFLSCHKSSACRTYKALEAERMCSIVRPAGSIGFFILSRAVVESLGASLPVPPQRSQLRPATIRHCIARAAFFLSAGHIPTSMADLTRRWTSKRTQPRIQALVERQVAAWKQEAQRLYIDFSRTPSEQVRRRYESLRRQLREPTVITAAGMASLKYFRGMHFLPTPNKVGARFVFIDSASTARRINNVIASCERFAAATMISTHLSITCGSEEAHQRISRLAAQTDLRIEVEILNLDYERHISGSAPALSPLVGNELKPVLLEIQASEQFVDA